ncbi:RDD family protein [Streptomyces sp. NPDC019396]|uniref:RDD family protein n=1 Tax=Streptomyces sp. NPDC019396 TaxID=3154687 RepID=UPI003406F1B2
MSYLPPVAPQGVPRTGPYPTHPEPPVAWHHYPVPRYGVPVGAGEVRPLAGLRARLGARVLDVRFWIACYWVVAFPVALWIDRTTAVLSEVTVGIWLLSSLVLYFPVCIFVFGCIFGKLICSVRIVRPEAGQRVGSWRAVVHEFSWIAVIPVRRKA